ncbi:hypothetical protein ACL02T_34075 [Pseudonocardia sp. RS010]|uniref:hypothetical protein n=1 Tax=Pseudonocardia sp. RS010 TaxID=3385979 RepID=UPI0039A26C7D
MVRVATARGPLVLASDAVHFYANLEARHVFAVTHDPDHLLEVYDRRLPGLVDEPADIVLGHDPLVLARYRARGVRGPRGARRAAEAGRLAPTVDVEAAVGLIPG